MADDVSEDDEVDALYALPLADFTAARDVLVKRLKKEGNKSAAETVVRLRKPTKLAWAVNQVARTQRDDVENLLEASDALREAQMELLAGGARDAFKQAAETRRRISARLADAVAELSGASTRDDAFRLLESLSSNDRSRMLLNTGRLTTERDADPGADVFGLNDLPASTRAEPKADGQPPKREPDELEIKRRQRDFARADQHLERASRRLATAQERLAQAEHEVNAATEAVNKAQAEREDAERALTRT